jgi:thioredoxin-related protein
MKYLSIALLLTLFAISNNGCTSDKADARSKVVNGEATPGFTTFEDAFAKAKADNKLVLVDVYTNWCGWCKRMDKDVYPDPKVQAELEKYFTAAKLNAESTDVRTFQGGLITEQQIASHWGVNAYPTLIFMNANGDVVERIPGYVPVTEFPLVLRFIGTGAYKETKDYEGWKKTHAL